MAKSIPLSILIALLLLAVFLLPKKSKVEKIKAAKTPAVYKTEEKKKKAPVERIGEKISYDVRMGKVKIGQANFTQINNAEVNGKMLQVMVFETKLPRFTDTETIYSDPDTLLPVKVERDIFNWFVREKIIEEYNQLEYTVSINKKRGGKEQNLVIKKNSPIHNAILLPHHVRRLPKLTYGKILTANLPNRQYEINLLGIEDITVPAGKFKAYHFESFPAQIEIWISADDRRIPLKIQSTATFGYLLILREYKYAS